MKGNFSAIKNASYVSSLSRTCISCWILKETVYVKSDVHLSQTWAKMPKYVCALCTAVPVQYVAAVTWQYSDVLMQYRYIITTEVL